jgi:RNA polymerase sigma-70 factor (ECF subfamily)
MKDFEQIYEDYFRDVFLYIRSLSRNDSTAEEIAQETFFKALKSIESFDERCDIRTWLIQIAKNTYFTYQKKSRRQTPFTTEDVIVSDCQVASVFEDKEMALRIHRFLYKMEEPYKEVFTLKVFAELPHSQIAELFGKTESWSRVTYHRAKAKIIEFIMEGES